MKEITFLQNEYWYGAYTQLGTQMPIDETAVVTVDLRINVTPNQATTWFASSKGRYLYAPCGYEITFSKGTITCPDFVVCEEGFETLKDAYLAVRKKEFKPKQCTDAFVREVVYNTWIELTYDQNQQDVMKYADDILNHDFPAGILMVDDGWSDYYGKWKFNKERFPDAKSMLENLHSKGFKVMFWVCPFISPDTAEFRYTRDKGYLIKTADKEPWIAKWWNGYSAVLDMSNPDAKKWLDNQLRDLMDLGVDGFKFDAGDSFFYPEDMCAYEKTTPNMQSQLWAEFASKYEYNELRVCTNSYMYPIMHRLCDKNHAWVGNGVDTLVPDALMAGILGYEYSCPDMIGGGDYINFAENADKLDQELFLRHCEIASFMPVMQFSVAPWRILDQQYFEQVKNCVSYRYKYMDVLLDAFAQSCNSCEPMMKFMEYVFPNQGCEKCNDQFMIGDDILVAPIYEKGMKERNVILPTGIWREENQGIIYEVTETATIKISGENGKVILLKKIS